MHSLPDNVGKGIRTVCLPYVRPSVRPPDLVTKVSHERLKQSRWNLQRIFIGPYW